LKIRAYLCTFLAASLLLADGGALQFRRQTGPLSIALFSAPVPLRVGAADLSVLVETAADSTAVLDASVELQLSKPGEQPIVVAATRTQATNKLLYAARPLLPSAGVWNVTLQVTRSGSTFAVPGSITVLPPASPVGAFWPYFALVPAGLLLFLANQWLKKRAANRPKGSR
jgi:hypothetical protein